MSKIENDATGNISDFTSRMRPTREMGVKPIPAIAGVGVRRFMRKTLDDAAQGLLNKTYTYTLALRSGNIDAIVAAEMGIKDFFTEDEARKIIQSRVDKIGEVLHLLRMGSQFEEVLGIADPNIKKEKKRVLDNL